MKKPLLTALIASASMALHAQQNVPAQWNTPGAGNPILPGYFADPTIRKFGDTYFVYATTDGTGPSSQPPQVWATKDFVNWQNYILNWPTTNLIWAPDVIQQPDGTYRYYYCTSECVIRAGESHSPVGPWQNILGEDRAVLVHDRFVHNAITLDPHIFRDDDGSDYLYFGTWGIYKDFGCGVAKMTADGKGFTDKRLIVNTEVKDFFEAPWVIKRNGIYYFLYSSGRCEDETYAVQYATAKSPMGPYEYKGKLLETTADGTVHGPGHNSVLQDGDEYYIVYHRHNNPLHSAGGYNRQTCIDKLEFDENGNILPIKPTHEAIIPKSAKKIAATFQGKNLAFGAKTMASSYYSDAFKPSYAIDDNNGTLWRAASNDAPASLTIDLGIPKKFDQVFIQFEYATFFYQYNVETSIDGVTWNMYADHSKNTVAGSPMTDSGQTEARYVRITILDTQHRGHFPAIWNVRIYQSTRTFNPLRSLPNLRYDRSAAILSFPWLEKKDVEKEERMQTAARQHQIFRLDADRYQLGQTVQGIPVVPKDGKTALRFNGSQWLSIDTVKTKTLTYNAPYTITAWILNPEISDKEVVAQLMPNARDRSTVELRNGKNRDEGIVCHYNGFHNAGAPSALKADAWQHWTVTYDGYMERIYCDGKLVSTKDTYLTLAPNDRITIGATSNGELPFSGYLHSISIYDRAFSASDVALDFQIPSSMTEKQQAEAAQISAIKGLEIHVEGQLVTPTTARIRVCDATGKPLTAGLYEYAYADGEKVDATQVRFTDQDEVLYSWPEGVKNTTVSIFVRDVFGNSAPVINMKFKTLVRDYNDLAATLEPTEKDTRAFKFTSRGANLDANPAHNGPMQTVEVTGDFILNCRIADMTGLAQRRTPAYNEGGVLMLAEENGQQRIIQLGAFPNYNCGNMLTIVNRGRPQYNNSTGYEFHRYMQLERKGNQVYARTSVDGRIWHEMPHSPVDASFLPATVKAGIYQATYTENEASVTISDVHLWQKK